MNSRRVGLMALVALTGCLGSALASSGENLQIIRVRGISLEMKALYDPLKDFQCLDGSMKLPFTYVNDDYCDCPDGSDEPGTAACARAKFHCVNLMHSPLDIPSSRVNDGICDCCDGSDEYSSAVSCANTCDELGRAAREEAKRREELLSQGGQLRRAMVDQGKQKVAEAKQKVEELKGSVENTRKERDAKELARKTAEDEERKLLDEEAQKKEDSQPPKTPTEQQQQDNDDDGGKAEVHEYIEADKRRAEDAFQELDANEDGIITFHEIMAEPGLIFDQDKNGQVSEDEAKFFLAYREEVDIDEFTSTAWPLIKPVWMLHRSGREERDPGTTTAHSTTEREDEDELLDELENNAEDSVLPPPTDAAEDHHDDHQHEDDQQAAADEQRNPAVKAAVEVADKARLEYHDAERKYKDMEQELEKYEQIVNGDFGDESEFAPLRGECFELTDKEYVYKLCPFDRCSQRPKDGGSETALGRWARWEARGGDGNKYATMKFEGGAGCWNGPARSTVVVMQCGLANQLMSASEPSRCEYQFEFASPAACTSGMPTAATAGQQPAQSEHDEL